MNEPVILTAEDFTDGRCTSLKGCILVLAHADLVGVAPAEGDTQSDARELLGMALEVAGDLPEIQVALLNCLAHPETSEQLSVYVSARLWPFSTERLGRRDFAEDSPMVPQ